MDVDPEKKAVNGSAARAVTVKVLRLACLVASLVLVSYWAWTFAGPYAALANLQLSVFGGYMNVVTWLLVWITVLLPLHFAVRLAALRAGLPFDAVALDNPEATVRFGAFVQRHFVVLLGLAFIVGGVAAGSYFLIDGYLAGPLSQLQVETLYLNAEPPTRYAEVTGRPLRSRAHTVHTVGSTPSRRGGGPGYSYFPLVPARWRAGEPIRVIVKSFHPPSAMVEDSSKRPDRLQGILRRGVDGFVLDGLRRIGNVAEDAWILDLTSDPEDDRRLGLSFMSGFSLFGLLLIAGGKWLAWRAGRN